MHQTNDNKYRHPPVEGPELPFRVLPKPYTLKLEPEALELSAGTADNFSLEIETMDGAETPEAQIIWDSSSGLKIPASALAKQDYYTIPVSFAVTDKNSSQTGFYSRNGSSIEFIKPDIVYMDDENCYIDPEDLPENTEIVSEDKSKTFKVSGKSSLSGVFNINRGYTLFCPVKVLYTYGDYCIVENLSGSGLVLYDHIILDGSTVKNNQVIYGTRAGINR